MSYKILPTEEFKKDFKKIDPNFQERIKRKIGEGADTPERYKHLRLDLKNFCRLRIGKLRIIFRYEIQKQELYLEKIVFDHKY